MAYGKFIHFCFVFEQPDGCQNVSISFCLENSLERLANLKKKYPHNISNAVCSAEGCKSNRVLVLTLLEVFCLIFNVRFNTESSKSNARECFTAIFLRLGERDVQNAQYIILLSSNLRLHSL